MMLKLEDVFLAVLSFGLGMLATLLAQVVSRRLHLSDARRKRKLEKLRQVRDWMEAYRSLFQCDYPEIHELVFGFQKSLRQLEPPLRVYSALKQYKGMKSMFEEAERTGARALWGLGRKKRGWLLNIPGRFADILALRWSPSYRQYPGCILYPRGFPRQIAPYLEELSELRYKLFTRFPGYFARSIDWEKLDYIEPSEVFSIVTYRLYEDQREEAIDLADARDYMHVYRTEALRAIGRVLDVVDEYEGGWVVPD